MMLGGKIVYPDECDYFSYKELLLRCPFCGQEVFLKAGACRKSHFAHFAGTDPNQVEQCELRASSYKWSSGINSFFQDRGQRLKIFQDRFLNLISLENDTPVTNLEFNNWINSIKRDYDQSIDSIIADCIHYFLKHCHKIADKYINTTVNINIQREIALEAIDYLCVKSSFNLLEYLLYFSIYKLLRNKQHKLFQQHITAKDVDSICHFVIKIIMFNNWIEVFRIEDDQKGSKDNAIYNDKNHFTKTKRSTGVKLSSSIQRDIDTTLISGWFTLPGIANLCQLRVNNQGVIWIDITSDHGRKSLCIVGYIVGSHTQLFTDNINPASSRDLANKAKKVRIFDWTYHDKWKIRTPTMEKQVQRFLAKCNKDVMYFLSHNNHLVLNDDGEIRYKAQPTQQQTKRKKLVLATKRR